MTRSVTTIEWLGDRVRFLDQSRLPLRETYCETDDCRVLARAIRSLSIRGAPLIGIAAAYGVALAARNAVRDGRSVHEAAEMAAAILQETRPTAVNLFWALDRMRRLASASGSPADVAARLTEEAIAIHREDAAMCRAIGEAGAALVPPGSSVLTHCNTGALATGGEGTAASILFAAQRLGRLRKVYVSETRPAFQGSRLTAWEMLNGGIEATIITDSTAASLMKRKMIDLVVVGADRIAANGDTVNKIGTYAHALAAYHHKIPFYVAAPASTIDPALADGKAIPIEERAPEEITEWSGVRIAPAGASAYAPAFDLTEAALISAIITERGVHHPPFRFTSHLHERD